jgi:hypothetical protein
MSEIPPVGDPDEDVSLRAEIHPRYARPMTMAADCSMVRGERQLKRIRTSYRLWKQNAPEFEFYSEEGPSLGGKGRHPLPLQYILGGIGT